MADVNINPTSHAYDETGVLPENYIENEQRDLANMNVRAAVTKYGAFFTETFVMRDGNGVIVPRDKYQFGLFHDILSGKIGKEICSAVVVLDKNVVAPIFVDYHCVGGPWGVSNERILELFNKLNGDDRPVSWPNILGKPDAYMPAHHLQDIGDLYGAEYFVAAMERLGQAFLMGDNASHDEIFRRIDENKNNADAAIADLQSQLNAHMADQTNSHKVTAHQTGTYTSAEIDQIVSNINQNLAANFVKKNVAEDLALTNSNGQLWCFLNGAYRVVWPPQWQ